MSTVSPFQVEPFVLSISRPGFGAFVAQVLLFAMILIARYDCFVSGAPSGSVDCQVRCYEVPEDTDLEAMLRAEPTDRYKNEDNEDVEWHYRDIVAVEWKPKLEHGQEIIGFISGQEELRPEDMQDD